MLDSFLPVAAFAWCLQESKRFAAVDRSWKSIMKRTYNHPKALEAGTIKGLKETLVRHNEVLEGIQKSLENYLEKKRCVERCCFKPRTLLPAAA